jgi:hypothetical protein
MRSPTYRPLNEKAPNVYYNKNRFTGYRPFNDKTLKNYYYNKNRFTGYRLFGRWAVGLCPHSGNQRWCRP